LVLLAFTIFYPISFDAYNASALVSLTIRNFGVILNAVFNSDLTNPIILLLIYALSAVSMTAGASKADFRIIASHTMKYWHFALFLLLAFSAGLEAARIFLGLSSPLQLLMPLASFILLSFLLVLLGITISLSFAAYLKFVKEFPTYLKLVAFAAFPCTYLVLIYTPFSSPLPAYFSILTFSLLVLLVWTYLLKFALRSLGFRGSGGVQTMRFRIGSLREYETDER
jgi:hypothetical protein